MTQNDCATLGRLARWADAARADSELQHICRWADFTVRAECNDEGTVWMTVSPDGITVDTQKPARLGADLIVLRASGAAWQELADANAAPRRHDLLSLTKADEGIVIMAGRIELIRHLRVLNRLVEIGRDVA